MLLVLHQIVGALAESCVDNIPLLHRIIKYVVGGAGNGAFSQELHSSKFTGVWQYESCVVYFYTVLCRNLLRGVAQFKVHCVAWTLLITTSSY